MCMSNLAVEFDENGDPYLADEAEEVDDPGCGCGDDIGVALDKSDAREAYEAVLENVPEPVRGHIEETTEPAAPNTGDRHEAGSD